MKKVINISIIIGLVALVLATGCTRQPRACISDLSGTLLSGQEVHFSDCSSDAHNRYWDFGDGHVSTETNPVHVYDTAGTYQVTLTVFSKGDMHRESTVKEINISQTLEQKLRGQWNFTRIHVKEYVNWSLNTETTPIPTGFIDFITDSTVVVSDPAIPVNDTIVWWTNGNEEITLGMNSWLRWDVQYADTLNNPSEYDVILTEEGFNGIEYGTRNQWFCAKE